MKCIAFIIMSGLLSLLPASEPVSGKAPTLGKGPLALTELWSHAGSPENPLSGITRLRVSATGEIFVMDRKQFRIFVFSQDGKLLRSFGKKGEGPGEIRMLIDFHLSPGRTVLVDVNSLHLFDHYGNFIETHKLPESENISPLFFVDDDRFVYAPRKPMEKNGQKELRLFHLRDKTSKLIIDRGGDDKPATPTGMYGGTVMVIGSGSYRDNEGLLAAAGPDNTLLWTFNGTPELVIADYSGRERIRFAAQGAHRMPIDEAAKQAAIKRMRIVVNGASLPKDMVDRLKGTIPDQATYYYFIGSGPARQAAIAAYISEFGRSDGYAFDFFSSSGEYVYQADWRLPSQSETVSAPPVFFGDRLYAVYSDPDGNIELHAYRVEAFKQ